MIRQICVYCGSQPGNNINYIKAANTLGSAMAKANIGLVYGGGGAGIMGAVAKSSLNEGGTVCGIIPEFLINREATKAQLLDLSETIITKDMHERKHKMFERSDAFITLPGGIGTLEEIVEMMTWAQLGRHEKPLVFLNTDGFWDPLLTLIDHMSDEGFIHTANKVRPLVVNNAEDIIPTLLALKT